MRKQHVECPLGPGAPTAIACLGLHLATRSRSTRPVRAYRDRDRVVEAHARGALALDDSIRVDGWTTTAGRYLVAQCLPPSYRGAADAPWDAARGERLIARITRELHVELAARAVAALEQLGRFVADRSGFSLALADFEPPRDVAAVIAAAHNVTARIENAYVAGEITDGERYNRVNDIWEAAAARARVEAKKQGPEIDPLAACAASCLDAPPPEALRSFRGVIQMAWGAAVAMTGTPARGSSTHEYFVRSAEARRATLDAAERDHAAAQLFRDLFAVLGSVEIVAVDCGTERSVRVRARAHDGDARASLPRHIEGRVAAETVVDHTGAIIAAAGDPITPAIAQRIDAAHVASVAVRDVRTCDARGGVCARCFGLAPEDAIWPSVGDGVGERASAAIANAARRLAAQTWVYIC